MKTIILNNYLFKQAEWIEKQLSKTPLDSNTVQVSAVTGCKEAHKTINIPSHCADQMSTFRYAFLTKNGINKLRLYMNVYNNREQKKLDLLSEKVRIELQITHSAREQLKELAVRNNMNQGDIVSRMIEIFANNTELLK